MDLMQRSKILEQIQLQTEISVISIYFNEKVILGEETYAETLLLLIPSIKRTFWNSNLPTNNIVIFGGSIAIFKSKII